MDPRESQVLMSMKGEILKSVDPLTIASLLFKLEYVSSSVNDTVNFLFRKGKRREEIILFLLDCVRPSVSFKSFLLVLHKCGYHKLTTRLFLKLYETHEYRMHNSFAEDRGKLQTFYRNLKHLVHDSQFRSPRQALRTLADRYKTAVGKEENESKRQQLADRCVTVLGVEIDAYYDSLGCKSEITPDEMLLQIKELLPYTSNTLITDTIRYSRQANLDAFHGDIEHAENMLVSARSSACNVGPCLELVNMLYIEVYVKLWQFEHQPTDEVLDAIMMWGRIGLESLEHECEEARIMWRRMFVLRMVFALLGLGNRCNILPNVVVDELHMSEAQNLLALIDQDWEGIETRREMFYCVARARLNEQKNMVNEAKLFIDRAMRLAEEGRFLEKIPFIGKIKTIIELHEQRNDLNRYTDDSNIVIELPLPHTTMRINRRNTSSCLAQNDEPSSFTEPKCQLHEKFQLDNSTAEEANSDYVYPHGVVLYGEQANSQNMIQKLKVFPGSSENLRLQQTNLDEQLELNNDHIDNSFSDTKKDSSLTDMKRAGSERLYKNEEKMDILKLPVTQCSDTTLPNTTNTVSIEEIDTPVYTVTPEGLSLSDNDFHRDLNITKLKEFEREVPRQSENRLYIHNNNIIKSDQHLLELKGNRCDVPFTGLKETTPLKSNDVRRMCHEQVELNSVVLFENRGDPEGASKSFRELNKLQNQRIVSSKSTFKPTDVNQRQDHMQGDVSQSLFDTLSTDIDDEQLFG